MKGHICHGVHDWWRVSCCAR